MYQDLPFFLFLLFQSSLMIVIVVKLFLHSSDKEILKNIEQIESDFQGFRESFNEFRRREKTALIEIGYLSARLEKYESNA